MTWGRLAFPERPDTMMRGPDMITTSGVATMAKKKADEKPKRAGTMVRVSDEFAEAMRLVTAFEGMSAAELADAVLLPILRKRYKDAVTPEARRLETGPK